MTVGSLISSMKTLIRLLFIAAWMTHAFAFAQERAPSQQAPQIRSSDPLEIPPYVARFGRTRPIVAVVGENTFTELTDYVVPFGVLSASGVAQVFSLATKTGPIQMFPALRVQPQATTSEFDARFPQGADYVIVPAVHKTEDPALLQWVSSQARKGARIVGICDGVWVVANAGLLAGKRAVGHWYSFDDLAKKFPTTTFVRNRRYVADGQVVTTTGVTASVPVSLALVEAIAGHPRAAALAQSLGVKDWGSSHDSANFHLSGGHAFTAAKNWLTFWLHEDVGIPVADGVDDIALALVADAMSRTYRSTAYAVSASAGPVKTRHGLLILPDNDARRPLRTDRTVELPARGLQSVESLDWALSRIAQFYGAPTAAFVALQIEYPKQ